MLLVPRQLRRVGMTGAVPYYGGDSHRRRRTQHLIRLRHRRHLRIR